MLRLYNTLTRQVEPFEPIEQGHAGIYSCGPTVYREVHIGNLRTYLLADWLRRVLESKGFDVKHVKNITDVGHMRQDLVERGEDKVLAAAFAAGKTPEQIAQQYTDSFLRDEASLNIERAHVFPRATKHVSHMIDMIERLMAHGLAYEVGGNVYYSVDKFPSYGAISGNTGESLIEGVRVEADPLKRDPRDFALWKAAEPGRAMKWPSPWGDGFPGWHIECSAMSVLHLGEQFDLHTGGVDNIFPHHEDERAQSEGALGHQVVRQWVHGQHLLVDGVKMAKSTGNVYTLSDIIARGYDPIAFRYLCATVHYRRRLNFTFESLRAAAVALARLRQEAALAVETHDTSSDGGKHWRELFQSELDNDLHMPGALAVTWSLIRSDAPAGLKVQLLQEFDEVLGFDLLPKVETVPAAVLALLNQRRDLRSRGAFAEADAVRQRIASAGYQVLDTAEGSIVRPLPSSPVMIEAVHSSQDVRSRLDEPDEVDFTVVFTARDDLAGLRRASEAVLRNTGKQQLELVIVDNGSTDGTTQWLQELANRDARVRPLVSDHNLGTGAARNCGLRLARGRNVAIIDTSIEFTGDVLGPIAGALADEKTGLVGAFGVNTKDLRDFEDASSSDVDAVEGYLMAFRRSRVREVGFMDEKFRFYRHLDLDYSLAFRERGYHNRVVPGLPIARHAHVDWERTPPEERERLSKRNFYRFLKKHGHRTDLLLANPRG